ncbi:MAG: heat-inducible transcription repressor HrcA [Endomicrobiales bacterium]|nr:heat-inducible transcription repressor HrcA [Endomicrobiales bacterium]
MRQIDPKVVKDRKEKVLQAIIHHYVKTGRPVGSNILTEDYKFDLSPATLRSLMSELEEEGFLSHPHTSAGRIPTDKGYRQYVDSLLEFQKLLLHEEERARGEYDNKIKELDGFLLQTSHILSALSHYSGFVITPKAEKNKLQYLELVRLSESKILVVMVTQTGMVKNKIVDASVSRERLAEISRLLNRKLNGMTLEEARQNIIREIEESEREEKEMFSIARALSRSLFDLDEQIFMEGASNVLTLPEFHDYEPMRCLLKINEDRDMLVDILEKNINKEGVRVLIGSEAHCRELKDLSVVSSVYKDGDASVGVLGIIGPKRMEYPRMMALVGAVTKIVNRFFEKIGK